MKHLLPLFLVAILFTAGCDKPAAAVAAGSLKAEATEFDGGRLGKLEVDGDNIRLTR